MTLRARLVLALILIALPVAAQSIWFYRGRYAPPDIPDVESIQVALATSEYRPVADQPPASVARVVIDLSHANNLEVDDLNPLRDRLAARGVRLETFDAADGSLADPLRGATALVVVAPTTAYTPDEREAIVDFVDDGGRLLLAADPTRPVPPEENEEGVLDFASVLFPTSAVPAINSLANAFGVVYFDDYLYDLVDNQGNYRNVKFTHFDAEHALTDGLQTIVLFAAHSLRSNGRSLVSGDDNTRSPMRRGENSLTAVALAAEGRALALGDISFLASPYHVVADNDRFLSNIADWLAIDTRVWGLEEFPFLFRGPVDLVQTAGSQLDPRLIARSDALREAFDKAGFTLDLRAEADPDRNTLFVGAFDHLEAAQAFLTTAGVTVTLTGADGGDESPDRPDASNQATPTPPPVSTATTPGPTTLTSTPTPRPGPESQTPTPTPGPVGTPAATRTPSGTGVPNGESKYDGEIEIAGLGTITVKGTTLFVVERSADRVVVVVLAENGEAALEALERLASHDFTGCLGNDRVTVCSTGEGEPGAGLGPSTGAESPDAAAKEDETKSGGRVFILSKDDGSNGRRTGAVELEAILGESHDVTVWSTREDGVPTSDDLEGYDAYILDSGDYASDADDFDAFAAMAGLGGRVMFIGAQPVPIGEAGTAPIDDLEIVDAAHPLAAGFAKDDVIPLLASESGVPAMVLVEGAIESSGENVEVSIVFARGPDSPDAGSPAVVTSTGDAITGRIIFAAFAFYQLPDEARRTFALNAVKWLMEE